MLIHLPINVHLDSFHLLATVNKAALLGTFLKAGLSGNLCVATGPDVPVDLMLSSLSVTALYGTLHQAEGVHAGGSSAQSLSLWQRCLKIPFSHFGHYSYSSSLLVNRVFNM